MTYIYPGKYNEINDYCKDYMPHYEKPVNLGMRSLMRAFETGLARETDRITHKPKPRVVPINIYPGNGFCSVEFKGKKGKRRIVEVPYTKEEIETWYGIAGQYKKENYRKWLNDRWDLGTHDWRRTGIVNLFLLYRIDWNIFLEIQRRTGHKSINEMQDYLTDYVGVKSTISKGDLRKIKALMGHMILL